MSASSVGTILLKRRKVFLSILGSCYTTLNAILSKLERYDIRESA